MDNYLLFKQIVCLILFFETLVLWPRFNLYFGPIVFPETFFKSAFRINVFNVALLIALGALFLNVYPVAASLFIVICMRYLFVTGGKTKISNYGAVGHMCFLVSAYIFFFELALFLDKSGRLFHFLNTVLAIEVGIIMISAGYYKLISGYLTNRGFEYALVNPNWGKLFFYFKKFKPSSFFFKINNYAAVILEMLSGVFFFFPNTRVIGASLLLIVFMYVFVTVRVNVLPLLMMGIALLYLHPMSFHFPLLNSHFNSIQISQGWITGIEAIFVVYLTIYSLVTLLSLIRISFNVPVPGWLETLIHLFISARPYFKWNVFTYVITDYFVKIEKASKETREITGTVYDGFLQGFNGNSRFLHHHESSLIAIVFNPVRNINEQKQLDVFVKKLGMYAKTLVSASELKNNAVAFTIMFIKKEKDKFAYNPVARFFVDAQSGALIYAEQFQEESQI